VKLNADAWSRIASRTSYVAGGYDEKAAFDKLAATSTISKSNSARRAAALLHFHAALGLHADPAHLGASGLAGKHLGTDHHSR